MYICVLALTQIRVNRAGTTAPVPEQLLQLNPQSDFGSRAIPRAWFGSRRPFRKRGLAQSRQAFQFRVTRPGIPGRHVARLHCGTRTWIVLTIQTAWLCLDAQKKENKAACGRTQQQSVILLSHETTSGEETRRPNQVHVQGLLVKDYAFNSNLHLAIEALR